MSKTFCRTTYLFLILAALAVTLGAGVSPDLVASKTDSVGGATTLGNGWTWTIVVTNQGPGTAASGSGASILYDQLPTNLTYGTPTATPGGGATGAVTCTIDVSSNMDCDQTTAVTIPQNGFFTITLPVNPPPVGAYVNPRAAGTCRADGPNSGADSNFFVESNYANNDCNNDPVVVAAPPPPVTGLFQVRYASNLINGGDAIVNITNTGASATALLTPGQIVGGVNQTNINGSLCVNIYTFAADEQEVACCSCLVTPNALWSASVKTALLNSTLTPSFPNEVVIKLIGSTPIVGTGGAQTCNPATLLNAGIAGTQAGVLAWGTSSHGTPTATGPTFQMTETPFVTATLTAAELQRDVQECQFIQILGSGQFGICKGCSNVGLGAAAE
jgi:uncharacterized repeat protein (TIGR01451 family)